MASPARQTVEEHWKQPLGNWRQQPDNEGPEATRGWWWPTGNPMMGGDKPWLTWRGDNSPPPELPEGFERIFGKKPRAKVDQGIWQAQLDKYAGLGRPAWITDDALAKAQEVWDYFGLGAPLIFERTDDGWWLAFPDAKLLPGFIHGAQLVFGGLHKDGAHKIVVSYQMDAFFSTGIVADPIHAMFPDHILN